MSDRLYRRYLEEQKALEREQDAAPHNDEDDADKADNQNDVDEKEANGDDVAVVNVGDSGGRAVCVPESDGMVGAEQDGDDTFCLLSTSKGKTGRPSKCGNIWEH